MEQRSGRTTWLALALLLITAATADAQPAQPKTSTYVLELTPFATHSGTNAMDLTYAPDGSGRVFVSTQSGQVFAYGYAGSDLGLFLDLATAGIGFTFDQDSRAPFRGLMYIAFHPDYAKPEAKGFGLFYTGHEVKLSESKADFDTKSFGGQGDSNKRFVIAEWKMDPNNPDRINPSSYRRVMMLNFHTYATNPHALGKIAFNPYAQPGEADYGKLYIAVGDGHNGDYSKAHNLARAQMADNPFGKILRIDPLASDGSPYTIPADNPLGTEVFATGLRDPQWFSFAKDLNDGVVLVTCDIGALLVEEINIVRPGGNYGWPRFEGTLDFETEHAIVGDAHAPVVHYGHAIPARVGVDPKGGMTAILGGIVVSDPDNPAFQGQILFGDLPRGTLMHANYHHALTVEQTGGQSAAYILTVKLGDKTGNIADVLGTERGDARFGFDQDNNIYIVSKRTDTIFKTGLVYTGEPVRADPVVMQNSAFGLKGLLITIGSTGGALMVILVIVYRTAKPRTA